MSILVANRFIAWSLVFIFFCGIEASGIHISAARAYEHWPIFLEIAGVSLFL